MALKRTADGADTSGAKRTRTTRSGGPPPAAPATAPAPTPAPPAPAPAPAPAPTATERPKDERGRFIRRTGAPAVAVAPAPTRSRTSGVPKKAGTTKAPGPTPSSEDGGSEVSDAPTEPRRTLRGGKVTTTTTTDTAPTTAAATSTTAKARAASRPDAINIYTWYRIPEAETKLTESTNVNKYLRINVNGDYRSVVTREFVPAGFLLLQEPCIFGDLDPNKIGYKKRLREQVEELPKDEQRQFLTLCHEDGTRKDTEESRIKCNAFSIANRNCVWYNVSFINHSCMPNAAVEQYNEEEGYNLRTLIDLPAGTEVLINYKPDWEVNEHRRDKIKPIPQTVRHQAILKQWGFACECEACSNPAATDADFDTLYRLESKLRFSYNVRIPMHQETYLQHVLQMLPLLKKYRLAHSLYRITKAAARCYEVIEDVEMNDLMWSWKLRFQREALDAGIVYMGKETIGDVEGVFRKKEPVEASKLATIASKIVWSLDGIFETSVAPYANGDGSEPSEASDKFDGSSGDGAEPSGADDKSDGGDTDDAELSEADDESDGNDGCGPPRRSGSGRIQRETRA